MSYSWEGRIENNWTIEGRKSCIRYCNEIIKNEKWKDLIEIALNKNSRLNQVSIIANLIGFDIWNQLFEKLKNNPYDSDSYFSIFQYKDTSRVKSVIDYIDKNVDLSEFIKLAEEKFEKGTCLQLIFSQITHMSGEGKNILNAALKSYMGRIHFNALKALSNWKYEDIPKDMATLVKKQYLNSNEKDIREMALKILNKN